MFDHGDGLRLPRVAPAAPGGCGIGASTVIQVGPSRSAPCDGALRPTGVVTPGATSSGNLSESLSEKAGAWYYYTSVNVNDLGTTTRVN